MKLFIHLTGKFINGDFFSLESLDELTVLCMRFLSDLAHQDLIDFIDAHRDDANWYRDYLYNKEESLFDEAILHNAVQKVLKEDFWDILA